MERIERIRADLTLKTHVGTLVVRTRVSSQQTLTDTVSLGGHLDTERGLLDVLPDNLDLGPCTS